MSVDEIRSFIVETFLFEDDKELSETTPLLEKHIVDSTGVLEIVSFLEQRFGIRVEDAELIPENLNSIRNIANYIAKKSATLV
ncbi:MAG: acyl carrier protein [Candidatus Aminicenantales bacterium]|jgi:acyl carrier protein